MKRAQMFWVGLVLVTGLFFILHAQETATPVQVQPLSLTPQDIVQLPALSDKELAALFDVLAATPLITPEDLPRASSGFWSLAHPSWPPLPASFGWPAWSLANGAYLLNDLEPPGGGMMLMDGPPGPGGGGGTNIFVPAGVPAQVFTTNDLWLSITGKTNTTAYLVIHPPWNVTNGVYDLFSITNLLPVRTWTWLLRTTAGQTNLTAISQTNQIDFFILGTMLDSDADGLTDAYENLVSHTYPNNPDSDGDGISDGAEVALGLNPLVNDNAQTGTRSNYAYGLVDWLEGISGIRTGSVSLDAEGNVLSVSQ